MILFIPQSVKVGEASKAVAEEDYSFGFGGIDKHTAVLQYLPGVHGDHLGGIGIIICGQAGPDLGGSALCGKVVGYHLRPGAATLAVGVAMEVYHGHQDIDVLPHLGGILAIVVLAVGLGHQSRRQDNIGIGGLTSFADLLAELRHAASGGDFLGRVVLVSRAAEADVVKMDAVHSVAYVLDRTFDDLVEIFLVVAVKRVFDRIDPLPFIVEGLEPDVHLHVTLVGLVYECECRIHSVALERHLVKNDVLDIFGRKSVEVNLVHELRPEPDTVEIGLGGFFAARQAEESQGYKDILFHKSVIIRKVTRCNGR